MCHKNMKYCLNENLSKMLTQVLLLKNFCIRFNFVEFKQKKIADNSHLATNKNLINSN